MSDDALCVANRCAATPPGEIQAEIVTVVLLTYALDDRWSNPEGMFQCASATGEVYRFLGAPDNLAFHLREGTHSHAPEDWAALLDFIAWKWQGNKPKTVYNSHPYEHLRPVFAWKAPRA